MMSLKKLFMHIYCIPERVFVSALYFCKSQDLVEFQNIYELNEEAIVSRIKCFSLDFIVNLKFGLNIHGMH